MRAHRVPDIRLPRALDLRGPLSRSCAFHQPRRLQRAVQIQQRCDSLAATRCMSAALALIAELRSLQSCVLSLRHESGAAPGCSSKRNDSAPAGPRHPPQGCPGCSRLAGARLGSPGRHTARVSQSGAHCSRLATAAVKADPESRPGASARRTSMGCGPGWRAWARVSRGTTPPPGGRLLGQPTFAASSTRWLSAISHSCCA